MKNIKYSKLFFYVKFFLRKIYRFIKIKGTGGTITARYCYSVFMRHIIHLFKNGMLNIPNRVAEFGPGDSIGIGLCVILAGAKEYYALDVVEHANSIRNLKIFDELVILFREKTPIPDNIEFPLIKPLLDDYSFPSYIFNDNVLENNISEKRINLIRNALLNKNGDDIVIKYIVPWENYSENYPEVDFVFSQAVLEHIDNLKQFYSIMYKILIKGGFVSHDIDFKSHNETYEWNGHWSISQKKWNKIRKAKPYLINREPLSTHLRLFEETGFQIKEKIPCKGSSEGKPSIQRKKLAEKYVKLSDEDFETSSCYIIAQKEN